MAKESGFTLVELIVTIVLIGITTGALSYMFISIQNIQLQATYMNSATEAAQTEIETLRNDNYASLTPGQTINFTSSLPSTLPANSIGSAVISQPSTDLRRVDSTVTYSINGISHTVTISSLIGAIGITQ